MKQLTAILLSGMIALPAAAQDADTGNDLREGLGLLSEGSRMILEGLMDDMRPMFEDHMLPMLQQLSDMVDDISAYHPPEILPNGDILIRRRVPLVPGEDGEEADEAPVDAPIDL